MGLEHLLSQAIEEAGEAKKTAPYGELARYYAILVTELEKMYAFYMLYLYPTEADVPPAEEIE